MSTTSFASPAAGAVRQRRHSAEFKARVLAQCQGAGVSVAAVARQHKFRPPSSAEDFVAALEAEMRAKRQGATRPVGFN